MPSETTLPGPALRDAGSHVKRNGRVAGAALSCCPATGDVGLEGLETDSEATDMVPEYRNQAVTNNSGEPSDNGQRSSSYSRHVINECGKSRASQKALRSVERNEERASTSVKATSEPSAVRAVRRWPFPLVGNCLSLPPPRVWLPLRPALP